MKCKISIGRVRSVACAKTLGKAGVITFTKCASFAANSIVSEQS
jgi:hypothetical protein